jgi:hypothetical protein
VASFLWHYPCKTRATPSGCNTQLNWQDYLYTQDDLNPSAQKTALTCAVWDSHSAVNGVSSFLWCSAVSTGKYRRFRVTQSCLFLEMKTPRAFKTSVTIHRSIWRNIIEYLNEPLLCPKLSRQCVVLLQLYFCLFTTPWRRPWSSTNYKLYHDVMVEMNGWPYTPTWFIPVKGALVFPVCTPRALLGNYDTVGFESGHSARSYINACFYLAIIWWLQFVAIVLARILYKARAHDLLCVLVFKLDLF